MALYIRVSTDEQADEGFSISAQKRRMLSYADSQDWMVSEIYIDDGYSAKDLNRPAMQQLMADVEEKRFDVVLVYKLDRMTRSSIDCDKLLKLFERHNVKFQSNTESFETRTATGRLFIRLVADIAQWERENIAERSRFGMEQMVHEGKRPGGPVPFGYEKDAKTIIPEEAAILRTLRSLYMAGNGYKSIAAKLNQMGMFRRGFKWGTNSVWYALENPYYAGKIRWGGKKANGKYATRKKDDLVNCIVEDSDQEKIFSWEEYVEHTNRMKRRSFSGYTKVREYWFSGVLICGKCGSRMSGRYHQNKRNDGSFKRIVSYICVNRQEGKGCTMPMFRQELVEHLIMNWIERIHLDQNQIDEIDVVQKEQKADSALQREMLQKELSKIKERRKKWQQMFAKELLSEEDLRGHNKDEQENEKVVLAQLAELPEKANTDASAAPDLLFELPDLWSVLPDKEKNSLIQDLFQEIVLDTPIERAQGRKGKFIPASIRRAVYG